MSHNEKKEEELALDYLNSDNPAKAIPHLIKAGGNARRRCANETAIKHYRQAKALLPDRLNGRKEEFFEVRLGLGKALKFIGEYQEAQGVLSDALENLENWKTGSDSPIYTPTIVETLRELADVKQREGAYDEAMNYLESGLEHLGKAAPPEMPTLKNSLMDRIAWVNFRTGELQNSFSTASSTLEDVTTAEIRHSAIAASLHSTMGGICWQQGKLNQAINHVETSLKLYSDLDNSWGKGVCYTNLGLLHDIKGNWQKAIDYYELAYALQKNIWDLENQARSLDNLGVLRMGMGDHDASRKDFEASLAIREKLGERFGIAQSRASLVQLALIENRLDDAALNAEVSLELAKAIGAKEVEVFARWIFAMVQTDAGEPQKGLAEAKQALQMARDGGFHDEEVDCLRIVGLLSARYGKIGEAEQTLKESIDLARKQIDPYREGLALRDLGRVSLDQLEVETPNREQLLSKAAKPLQEAIVKFESIGAVYNLSQTKEELSKCRYGR